MIIQCILVLPLFLAVASGSLVENVCCGRCAVAVSIEAVLFLMWV
jgi:hypothetical protein